MHNKNYRNKIKTLCTIETSDIELQDPRPSANLITPALLKRRDKMGQSPSLRKGSYQKVWTPSHLSNKNVFKTCYDKSGGSLSQNKSRSKSLFSQTMRSKSKIKTDFCGLSEFALKSTICHSAKAIKSKLLDPFEQPYKKDSYKMIQELVTSGPERQMLVSKGDKIYLMKKTKSSTLKSLYQKELALKQKIPRNKWNNLVKIVKVYQEKVWAYAIYQYQGDCLNWLNVISLLLSLPIVR